MRFAVLVLCLFLSLPAYAGNTPHDPGFFYKFVRSFSKEGAIKMWRGGQRPDLPTLLTMRGFVPGAPLYLRIFKEEGVIEAWLGRGDHFELFEIYPICVASGALGPKQREGDGQAPEGFYEVTANQLNPNSRYHLALNMGYPNAFDRQNGRTGAALMIHGACVSIGCYALTNSNIDEVYALTEAALARGQASIPVHAFPFRMTPEAMARHKASAWMPFWTQDLLPAYREFTASREPPRMMACQGVYHSMTGYDPAALPEGCEAIKGW